MSGKRFLIQFELNVSRKADQKSYEDGTKKIPDAVEKMNSVVGSPSRPKSPGKSPLRSQSFSPHASSDRNGPTRRSTSQNSDKARAVAAASSESAVRRLHRIVSKLDKNPQPSPNLRPPPSPTGPRTPHRSTRDAEAIQKLADVYRIPLETIETQVTPYVPPSTTVTMRPFSRPTSPQRQRQQTPSANAKTSSSSTPAVDVGAALLKAEPAPAPPLHATEEQKAGGFISIALGDNDHHPDNREKLAPLVIDTSVGVNPHHTTDTDTKNAHSNNNRPVAGRPKQRPQSSPAYRPSKQQQTQVQHLMRHSPYARNTTDSLDDDDEDSDSDYAVRRHRRKQHQHEDSTFRRSAQALLRDIAQLTLRRKPLQHPQDWDARFVYGAALHHEKMIPRRKQPPLQTPTSKAAQTPVQNTHNTNHHIHSNSSRALTKSPSGLGTNPPATAVTSTLIGGTSAPATTTRSAPSSAGRVRGRSDRVHPQPPPPTQAQQQQSSLNNHHTSNIDNHHRSSNDDSNNRDKFDIYAPSATTSLVPSSTANAATKKTKEVRVRPQTAHASLPSSA